MMAIPARDKLVEIDNTGVIVREVVAYANTSLPTTVKPCPASTFVNPIWNFTLNNWEESK